MEFYARSPSSIREHVRKISTKRVTVSFFIEVNWEETFLVIPFDNLILKKLGNIISESSSHSFPWASCEVTLKIVVEGTRIGKNIFYEEIKYGYLSILHVWLLNIKIKYFRKLLLVQYYIQIIIIKLWFR